MRAIILHRFRFGRSAGALAVVALLGGLIAGCDDQEASFDTFLTRAEDFREEGDFRASIIEAKNALQIEPADVYARYLLGVNYLDLGAWSAAETTLEQAASEGAPDGRVLTALARAKLERGKFDEVLTIARVTPDMPAELAAALHALRGQALIGEGERAEAEESFQAALKADESSFRAWLGLARLAAMERETEKADALLAKAVAIAPDAFDVLHFQAQYAVFKGKREAGEELYRALLKDRPGRFDLLLAVAELDIAAGRLDAATEALDGILEASPNNPRANYLRALTAYRSKNYSAASAFGNAVLRVDATHAPTLRILGAAAYAQGQDEQAVRYLRSYLARGAEPDAAVQKLLGAAQLRLGRPAEAARTLEAAAEKRPDDAALLSMIGAAAARAGDLEKSSAYFQKTVDLQPENARARAALGVTKAALGQTELGIEELKRAIEADPELDQAETALIVNLLRAKRNDEALAAAKRLQEKRPDSPAAYNLTGIVQLALGNEDEAKALFQRTLELDENNAAALRNLAQLALRKQDFSTANTYLHEALKADPSHFATLMQLADIAGLQNDVEGTQEFLKKAVEARPDSLEARMLLGRLYLKRERPTLALSVVGPGLRQHPDSSGLLEVSGLALLRTKAFDSAAARFARLVELNPDSASAHRLLARAYAGGGAMERAEAELEKALEKEPQDHQARVALTRLHISSGRFDTARKNLAILQKETSPTPPDILVLEGDLLARERKYDEAATVYLKAAERAPSGELAVKTARARMLAGNASAARETLAAWLEKHPGDAAARLSLGDHLLEQGDLEGAAKQFEELVKRNDDSWVAHNQLAWTYLQAGKVADARRHAARARDIAPEQPAVMDTMALVHMKEGKPSEALPLLQEAARRLPRNPDVQTHLAQVLMKLERRDEALRILEQVLATHPDFSEREEAEELRDELARR